MSVIASIISGSASIKDNHTSRPGIRELKAMLRQIGDFDTPTNCAGKNEVQQITAITGGVDGGTYKLTFTLWNGQSFTTANIAHSANAATIQTAINVAATSASITGWTNGDIVVGGGPLHTTTTTFTFSGASVAARNHGLVTQDGALLTVSASPGGAVGTASATTQGQIERTAWALLFALGILGGTIPNQGDLPASVTARLRRGQFPHSLCEDSVRALVREAAIADRTIGIEAALLTLLGY